MNDAVNHPPHYQGSNGIEAIQVIEGFDLTYNEGVSVAYVLRAKRKGARIEDLKKAVWHLQREIGNLEAAAAATAPTPFREMRGVLNVRAGAEQVEKRVLLWRERKKKSVPKRTRRK